EIALWRRSARDGRRRLQASQVMADMQITAMNSASASSVISSHSAAKVRNARGRSMLCSALRFALGLVFTVLLGKGPMIEILDQVRRGGVFEPEIIQMLASAFEDAWERIEKSGSRFARPAYARAMREVIARRVVEMAQQGVTDPQALADDAIRFVRANYRDDV